ncbi:MAG: hypothetical protein QM703_14160 [Gemmatales bacterium]
MQRTQAIGKLLSQLSRREFMLASGTALMGTSLLADDFDVQSLPSRHVFRLSRDLDLLNLEIEFVQFRERKGFLESIGAGRSLVVVHFPPQNLAEATFLDMPGDENKANPKEKKLLPGNARAT